MNFLEKIRNKIWQTNKFNPYEYEIGDIVWAKHKNKNNSAPYLIINIDIEKQKYLACSMTSAIKNVNF